MRLTHNGRVAGYLAACAIFRDEAPDLAEWLEFHLLVGFEHLFLYNNRSQDGFAEVLAPYVAERTVTLTDWPEFPGQLTAYDHCIRNHGEGWRWMAFIDLDEFLFSPRLRPVPEVLSRYEHLPGLGVVWATFGTSGHATRPAGLAIESYVQRLAGRRHLRQYKSVVDPTAVTRAYGPHSFAYRDPALATVPVPRFAAWDDLRVNHYLTRSEEEYRGKLATPDAFGEPRNVVRPQAIMRIPTVHDDAIAAYAPAVREALERRAGAAFPGTGA
jgi:Glycosyltransferase family 92